MLVIDKTKSLCPVCFKTIDADVVNEAGTVYVLKMCDSHGFFKSKHPWSNFRDYNGIKASISNSAHNCCADGLVINLNSLCNLNCPFCFARANEYQIEEPDLDKINGILKDFKGTYVYLCGGEPTLRKDILDIIASIKRRGYRIGLFTNGKALTDLEYTEKLKKAGLELVILQFDTLDDDQYELLRGERLLSMKLNVINNLRICRIPVYLFAMLSRGVNVGQIGGLFDFVLQNRDIIKLINLNPVWGIGRIGAFEEMGASEILLEVERRTSLGFEDFISSTEFSYNLFEIIRKLIRKGGRKHPQCEMRCYAFASRTALIPISRILSLKRINESLKAINDILTGNLTLNKILKVLSKIPYATLLKDFLRNSLFRKIALKSLMVVTGKKDIISLNIVSIIVGTFHTSYNIDLNMVNTCNLFSDYKSGNISSCLRQIHFLEDITANKVTVS